MELWIAASDGLEYSTIKQRSEHKRLHIDPFIGSLKLASLTTPRVYALDQQLRDNGCSLAMRRKILTSVKMMLTHSQRTGRVAQNVALAVRIKTDDKRQHAPLRAGRGLPQAGKSFAPSSTRQRAAGDHGLSQRSSPGMRASELRGLPWANVASRRRRYPRSPAGRPLGQRWQAEKQSRQSGHSASADGSQCAAATIGKAAGSISSSLIIKATLRATTTC